MRALGNLLLKALKLIPPTPVEYSSFLNMQITPWGAAVPQYAEAVKVKRALIQSLNSTTKSQLGLTLSVEYKLLHIPADLEGVSRKISGDKVEYRNRVYIVDQVLNNYEYDNWDRLVLVEQKDYHYNAVPQ